LTMAKSPGSDEVFYVGTMDGWYLETELSDVAIAAHWVCFLALTVTTFFLAWESWSNRGPSKKAHFYAGYQEEQNLALFVNFFAMVSYYGKVVSDTLGHNFTDVGPFILGFGNYRYADYMLTCPMLVYDLLYQLRAPFRVSLSAIIFAILLSGVIAEVYTLGDPRLRGGAYAWYGFGLFWFCCAYVAVMTIVARQYARLAELAKNTGAVKSLSTLKFAVFTFSMLWILFPLTWAVCPRGLNWIDDNMTEVMHCLCDIIAKSCYGWALARFRKVYDEELFFMVERLGMDEEEFERLEKDMRLSAPGTRLQTLSKEKWKNRRASDFLTTPTEYVRQQVNGASPKKGPGRNALFPKAPPLGSDSPRALQPPDSPTVVAVSNSVEPVGTVTAGQNAGVDLV